MLWSDDAGLWESMLPALAGPHRFAPAEADVAAILGRIPIAIGSAILDAGCGAGAHATAFVARGFRVTGIDTSQALLERARAHAAETGAQVDFLQADMRVFVRPLEFHLACSLNSSFAYFDGLTHENVLRNINRSLGLNGVLVLDTLGEGVIADSGKNQEAVISGVRYCCRRAFDPSLRALDEFWTVESSGQNKQYHTQQRIYTQEELTALLYRAGFRFIEISASLDGTVPYSSEAGRLVAVARRPME